MIMKKTLAVVLAANAAVVFGGEMAPSETGALLIDAPGVYTASSDLAISDLTVKSDGVVFDFSAAPERKVDLTSMAEFIMNLDTPTGATTTFKGGVWNCVNHGASAKDVCFYLTPANGKRNHTVILENGCTITNLYRTMNRGDGLDLSLSGGSVLSMMEFWLAYGSYTGNKVSILDGSQILCSSSFSTDQANGTPTTQNGRHSVLVRGEGSALKSAGNVNISYRYPGCSLVVDDGALLEAQSLNIGNNDEHATNATFTLSKGACANLNGFSVRNAGHAVSVDGATLNVNNTEEFVLDRSCSLAVANNAVVSFAHYVQAHNGASIDISSSSVFNARELRFFDGSSGSVSGENTRVTLRELKLSNGSRLLLDNAYLKVTATPSMSDCFFRMSGPRSQFDGIVRTNVNPYDIVSAGASNVVFEIADGAVVNDTEHKYYMNLFSAATNCTLRITGEGSKLAIYDGTETFCFGAQTAPLASVSNVVEVSDGGCLDIGVYRHGGLCNTLVISNGTVRSLTADGEFNICYRHYATPDGQNPTNALVVMRGSTPKFKVEHKRVYFNFGSTLRFEIPEDGYAEGYVPFEAYGLRFTSLADSMEVDCAAFAAKEQKKSGRLVLVRNLSEDFGGMAKSVVEACSAKLPPKCRLFIHGRDIVLKCPRKCGEYIFIR